MGTGGQQSPRLCDRRLRSLGFEDGAEWMLNEVCTTCAKRNMFATKSGARGNTDAERRAAFVSSVYSHLIKDLGEWKPE